MVVTDIPMKAIGYTTNAENQSLVQYEMMLKEGCRILAADDGSQITDSSHPLAGRGYILAQKPQ